MAGCAALVTAGVAAWITADSGAMARLMVVGGALMVVYGACLVFQGFTDDERLLFRKVRSRLGR